MQLLSFSCRHNNVSQPFASAAVTATKNAKQDWEPVTASPGGHYVVCLDCGKQFGYDWSKMRIMK
ncbi:MAG TPA: hypothetical protein VN622_14110 [Clostridia bacterium]|nr:hypothetical protein [Clostridia bacterium]